MIEKPEQYYDTRRHQLYYQWRKSEHYIHREPIYDRTRNYIESLDAENAKLLEILKSLMMGTNAELCAGRGESDCKECSMHHGDGCAVVNAMELLGIDMYGEPLGIEVEK